MTIFLKLIVVLSFFAFGSLAAFAQGADGKPIFGINPHDCEHLERNLRETCFSLRIKREKKEHNEMLDRGEEVRRLSERLERSYAQNGRLSDEDHAVLDALEKNVKKIRSELGGGENDEELEDLLKTRKNISFTEALDILKVTAVNLADELKKTSRFTISATAIQTSNSVINVARFLRIKN